MTAALAALQAPAPTWSAPRPVPERGLLVAGPPGAVVGGVIGAVWGKPFWGPSISKGHCWTDNNFHRHCNRHWE